MSSNNLLFTEAGRAMTPAEIREGIAEFAYKEATQDVIRDSEVLSRDVFVRCTARIMSNFGMTRSGAFKGVKITASGNVIGERVLLQCWTAIGDDVRRIRDSVSRSGYPRGRYLRKLTRPELEGLTAGIWRMTKRLLPITMGEESYGLTGASKVLFAVLPEIVLPVDKKQWLKVFRTVDLGDVICRMVIEIREWEETTGHELNEVDDSGMLTTLPSVYNVMAMDARRE